MLPPPPHTHSHSHTHTHTHTSMDMNLKTHKHKGGNIKGGSLFELSFAAELPSQAILSENQVYHFEYMPNFNYLL